ncbi:exodeoxyribonuclease III [Candidatus Magnetomonas plexicatena]|uniref:exodeoxyribonuclease III n=1 Tax=Candidatus Magnetomonas plexicatena TaxID=2552947 RepID=UPI001103802A|nr:exodeoxyribonuclease III [Nitrospirales bacterium LBB_01]
MKICSFNVNSIKARLEVIAEWLKRRENDIDVLCLQELKGVDETFPHEFFNSHGFHYCETFGQKAYNGVAICSKLPLTNVKRGFTTDCADAQRRIIQADISGITIINVYVPHGDERGTEKYYYKLNWYKSLLDHIEAATSKNIVIVGDLNVTREDIDVYDPKAYHDTVATMPEERESLQRIIDCGLTDAFRHLYPDVRQYTWWAYGAAIWKDQGLRIDYVLTTKEMIKRLRSIEVDVWPRKKKTLKPSDHAPLIVEFDVVTISF